MQEHQAIIMQGGRPGFGPGMGPSNQVCVSLPVCLSVVFSTLCVWCVRLREFLCMKGYVWVRECVCMCVSVGCLCVDFLNDSYL